MQLISVNCVYSDIRVSCQRIQASDKTFTTILDLMVVLVTDTHAP